MTAQPPRALAACTPLASSDSAMACRVVVDGQIDIGPIFGRHPGFCPYREGGAESGR